MARRAHYRKAVFAAALLSALLPGIAAYVYWFGTPIVFSLLVASVVIVNALVDLAYLAVDPRLRRRA